MRDGIRIQADVPKGHVLDVADAIDRVFASAYNNHINQDVVVAALETLQRGAKIEGVTISNTSVFGEVSSDQ